MYPVHVKVGALVASVLVACTVKDPLFCRSDADCIDNFAGNYCDLTGDYEPQHIRNTCVPSPFDARPPDARTASTLSVAFGGTGGGTIFVYEDSFQCTSSRPSKTPRTMTR